MSDEASSVVAPIVQLYQAGHKYLPDAASQFNVALSYLDQATTPAGLSDKFFPRSITKYEEARGLLAHIFTVTRDNVLDAGTALEDIARDYEVTDEGNAEAIATQMEEIDASTAAWRGSGR